MGAHRSILRLALLLSLVLAAAPAPSPAGARADTELAQLAGQWKVAGKSRWYRIEVSGENVQLQRWNGTSRSWETSYAGKFGEELSYRIRRPDQIRWHRPGTPAWLAPLVVARGWSHHAELGRLDDARLRLRSIEFHATWDEKERKLQTLEVRRGSPGTLEVLERDAPPAEIVVETTTGEPLETLNSHQPFHVKLLLPRGTVRPAKWVRVRIEGRAMLVGSAKLWAEESGARGDQVRYRTERTTLWDLGLSFDDGETLTVSHGETVTQVTAWINWVKQAIAALERDLAMAQAFYLDALKQVESDPRLSAEEQAAALKAIEAKLALIARIRAAMAAPELLRPPFYDQYSRLAVARHLMSLLGTDPETWGPTADPGDRRTIGGIRFTERELALLQDAFAEAAALRKSHVRSSVAEAAVYFYRLYANLSGGASLWKVITGTDEVGSPISLSERLLAGVDVVSRAAMAGAQVASALRRGFPKTTATRGLAGEARAASSGKAGASVPTVGARPVHTDKTLIGGAMPAIPTGSRGTPLQRFGDTCGLNVAEGMRRDAGLAARGEKVALQEAFRNKQYVPGRGMTTQGLADYLKADKAVVTTPKGMDMAKIGKEIQDGRQVAVMINTGTQAKPNFHWVRVEKHFTDSSGKGMVSVGDPWNGNSWFVGADDFVKQMNPNEVVVAKW